MTKLFATLSLFIFSIFQVLFCALNLPANNLPIAVKSNQFLDEKIDLQSSENDKADFSKCIGNKGRKSLLLWSIVSPKQKVRSYLFGTIHVSYDEVWDYVSEKVKEVFSESESIVFELELQNPETIDILLHCKNLDNNQSLRKILPTFLYDRLKHYMRRFKYKILQWANKTFRLSKADAKREAKRLYSNIAGDWEVKRPVWLLFLLYQMSESNLVSNMASLNSSSNSKVMHYSDETTPMLDVFMAQKAQELGKRLHSIETPAEQCNPLFSIDQDQIIFAINYTLSYLEWIEKPALKFHKSSDGADAIAHAVQTPRKSGLAELIEHYRCGSLEESVFNSKRFNATGFSISRELDQKAKKIDNLLVDDIILKRNVRMAERADNLLQNSPKTTFFFAIGAGHFLGEKSLIKLLDGYGYSIFPVKETDDVMAYFRNHTFSQAHSNLKFNELWVRDALLPASTKPNFNLRSSSSLSPMQILAKSKQKNPNIFKTNFSEDANNKLILNDKNIQISISLYEIPLSKELKNSQIFRYLNCSAKISFFYLLQLFCTLIVFAFSKNF